MSALPRIVAEHCARWDLVIDGRPMHGYNGLAVPVRRGDEPLVLKVGWPDRSVVEQGEGLRLWGGRGTVLLVDADLDSGALLLERLDSGRSLQDVPLEELLSSGGSCAGSPCPPPAGSVPPGAPPPHSMTGCAAGGTRPGGSSPYACSTSNWCDPGPRPRVLASPDVVERDGSPAEDDRVYVGNAGVDGPLDGGWLLGHFKPPGDVRHSEAVEIKWGLHKPGDERARWVTGENRTALLILISGRFRVELPGRSVLLAERGDYVVWGEGVDHSWLAEDESVVLTVRWPSVPGHRVT
ncbi:aminoglycoside phosphotransferase family protein [Nonomuraea sp. NPDC049486]|uniref:aminoglycoside phosphotransferase family protein n=1 Tax=Nonomuraea sp. NPDC049486 TaxID=3155773 RepID=UPI00343E013B